MIKTRVLMLRGPGPGNGTESMDGIRKACRKLGEQLNLELEIQQADDAAGMARCIREDGADCGALIVAPAPVRQAADDGQWRQAIDAFTGLDKPVIEVHERNIFVDRANSPQPLRGPERGLALICGLGLDGYLVAIRSIAAQLGERAP